MLPNVRRIVLLTFFARLHFYIHVSTIYFQSRGLDLFQVNSIDALVILTIFLAEVPTGVIADRVGRKWSIVIALLLRSIAEFLILFGQSYSAFVPVAFLIGIGFAFESGATEALVYDSLPQADREETMKRVMGTIGSVANLGFFISPFVGSLIVSQLTENQFALAIVLTSGSLFTAFLLSLTLRDGTSKPQSNPNSLAIFRAGFDDLRKNPALQRIVLISLFTTALGGILITLTQPYLVAYDAPVWMMGVALGVGSLMASVTQKYAYLAERWFGKRWGLFIVTLVPGILYVLLALTTNASLVLLLVILLHGLGPIKSPLLSAYQNAQINAESRATVLSLINMLMTLWVALATLIYGALAEQSLPLAFGVMGTVIISAVLLLRVDRIVE